MKQNQKEWDTRQQALRHVLATHIAHAGNPPHPQISVYSAQYSYEVAYDGLSVLVNR